MNEREPLHHVKTKKVSYLLQNKEYEMTQLIMKVKEEFTDGKYISTLVLGSEQDCRCSTPAGPRQLHDHDC